MKSFVRPYGFVADTCGGATLREGWAAVAVRELTSNVSSTGTLLGSPYTVADEEKTMFLQLYLVITSSRLTVPVMLFP